MKLLAKLQCRIFGHRRGKRMNSKDDMTVTKTGVYQCPRCAARWVRKVKAAA